jgi:antirestriction protein
MKEKTMTIMTEKEYRKKAQSILRRGNNLNESIQELIIEGGKIAQDKNGDFTLLSELYNNFLTGGINKAQFRRYVVSLFPCRFVVSTNKAGAKLEQFKKDKSDSAKEYNFSPSESWHVMTEDTKPEARAFDLEKSLASLAKRALKSLSTEDQLMSDSDIAKAISAFEQALLDARAEHQKTIDEKAKAQKAAKLKQLAKEGKLEKGQKDGKDLPKVNPKYAAKKAKRSAAQKAA